MNHTVWLTKTQESRYFRQNGIWLREAGADEIVTRSGGASSRLHCQKRVPESQRDLLPGLGPGSAVPWLAPGSCHRSWDPGINSYRRRAAPEPRCACWSRPAKQCPCPAPPHLMQRCDKRRGLSAEATQVRPLPTGPSRVSHSGICLQGCARMWFPACHLTHYRKSHYGQGEWMVSPNRLEDNSNESGPHSFCPPA